MTNLELKEKLKPYSDDISTFGRWKRKKMFPEVLNALLGETDHIVFNIDEKILGVKRKGYLYPHFFVDKSSAIVYCQFWR